MLSKILNVEKKLPPNFNGNYSALFKKKSHSKFRRNFSNFQWKLIQISIEIFWTSMENIHNFDENSSVIRKELFRISKEILLYSESSSELRKKLFQISKENSSKFQRKFIRISKEILTNFRENSREYGKKSSEFRRKFIRISKEIHSNF